MGRCTKQIAQLDPFEEGELPAIDRISAFDNFRSLEMWQVKELGAVLDVFRKFDRSKSVKLSWNAKLNNF